MMAFCDSTVSAPQFLESGSCQASRIDALLFRPLNRQAVTPEWREKNQLKQLAYDRRGLPRKEPGIVDSE